MKRFILFYGGIINVELVSLVHYEKAANEPEGFTKIYMSGKDWVRITGDVRTELLAALNGDAAPSAPTSETASPTTPSEGSES